MESGIIIPVKKKDEEKENKSMSTIVLKNTDQKVFEKQEKKAGLRERFAEYWRENSAMILSGMMALNGNTDAYRTYCMLRK